jgi:hypothetical protein
VQGQFVAPAKPHSQRLRAAADGLEGGHAPSGVSTPMPVPTGSPPGQHGARCRRGQVLDWFTSLAGSLQQPDIVHYMPPVIAQYAVAVTAHQHAPPVDDYGVEVPIRVAANLIC